MPEDSAPSTSSNVVAPTFEFRPDGRITFDGIAVGRVEGDRIRLNAGWLAEAGAHVTIEQDPRVDSKRGGVILDR